MTLRFRLVPPSRADRTLLPAALVAVLAFAALVQLVATDAVDLPSVGPIGVGAPLPPVREPDPRGVPGAILSRAIFAPHRAAATSGDGGGDSAPADPLGGATILGSVGVGRARYAMVQQDGAIRRVGIGGTIAGWRLVGLGQEGALLVRGRERLRRSFGAGGATTRGNGGSSSDDVASEDQ